MGEHGAAVKGHSELREFFRRYYETWENRDDTLEELIDVGEHVVAVVTTTARGRTSGVDVELKRNAGVWTVRNGRVVRVVWYPSREEALAAARAPGTQASGQFHPS
jgi:ketosteroid isomerase-like protein